MDGNYDRLHCANPNTPPRYEGSRCHGYLHPGVMGSESAEEDSERQTREGVLHVDVALVLIDF